MLVGRKFFRKFFIFPYPNCAPDCSIHFITGVSWIDGSHVVKPRTIIPFSSARSCAFTCLSHASGARKMSSPIMRTSGLLAFSTARLRHTPWWLFGMGKYLKAKGHERFLGHSSVFSAGPSETIMTSRFLTVCLSMQSRVCWRILGRPQVGIMMESCIMFCEKNVILALSRPYRWSFFLEGACTSRKFHSPLLKDKLRLAQIQQ